LAQDYLNGRSVYARLWLVGIELVVFDGLPCKISWSTSGTRRLCSCVVDDHLALAFAFERCGNRLRVTAFQTETRSRAITSAFVSAMTWILTNSEPIRTLDTGWRSNLVFHALLAGEEAAARRACRFCELCHCRCLIGAECVPSGYWFSEKRNPGAILAKLASLLKSVDCNIPPVPALLSASFRNFGDVFL